MFLRIAGASELQSGAAKVSQGASALESGLGDADSGASALSTGASTLQDGLGSAVDGANALGEGAKELSDGLTEGQDAIGDSLTTFSEDLGTYVSDPVSVDEEVCGELDWFGFGFAPLFMSMAMWLGAGCHSCASLYLHH